MGVVLSIQLVVASIKGRYDEPPIHIPPPETSQSQPATGPVFMAVDAFTRFAAKTTNSPYPSGLEDEIRLRLVRTGGIELTTLPVSIGQSPIPADSTIRRYVLKGSVHLGDKTVRVIAHLIDTQTSEYVWSHEFERLRSDSLEQQKVLGGEIVAAIVKFFGPLDSTSPVAVSDTQLASQLTLRGTP